MDKHSKGLLATSAVLFAVGIGLGACDDSPPERKLDPSAPHVHKLYRNPSGWVDGWIDDNTGCQYIGDSQPYMLRYTVDGKPWCGLPPAQQRGRPEGVQP